MLDGPSAPGQIVVSAATNADGSYPGGLVAGSSRGGTHKALVSADSFNVSVLFGPTLAFLERVKEIMPGGSMGEYDTSSGFAGFLDDFVLRTFLPQLEEKVTSVFHQAVGGQFFFSRSFQTVTDPASRERCVSGRSELQEILARTDRQSTSTPPLGSYIADRSMSSRCRISCC